MAWYFDFHWVFKFIEAVIVVVLLFPSITVWVGMLYTILHGGKDQRMQIGKAFDCLGNAATGGAYNAMISERVGRESATQGCKLRYKVLEALINIAALPFEKFKWGHCRRVAGID